MGTNTVPELTRVGWKVESTWGTNPASNASIPVLLPVEPPDIKEEIEHITDEQVRGVLGRDFEAYAGQRKVTGSLKGNCYLNSDGDETSTAALTGHLLELFFGSCEGVDILTASPQMRVHNFYITNQPASTTNWAQSWTLQVEDGVAGLTESGSPVVPCYVGVMIPKLTLHFNAGEGLLTWEAELLGVRQKFVTLTSAPGGDTTKSKAISSTDKSGAASLGAFGQVRVVNGTTIATGWTGAKLLSADITLQRDIEYKVGAAGQNYPNLRALRTLQATFTAVVELQTYADVKMYSNDTTADFTGSQYKWHFRFGTVGASSVTMPTPNYDTTQLVADEKALETNLGTTAGVLDILMHTVDLGEGPLSISRDAVANTLEFQGRALLTPSPAFLGMASEAGYNTTTPGATAQLGQKVVQVRLLNNYGAGGSSTYYHS